MSWQTGFELLRTLVGPMRCWLPFRFPFCWAWPSWIGCPGLFVSGVTTYRFILPIHSCSVDVFEAWFSFSIPTSSTTHRDRDRRKVRSSLISTNQVGRVAQLVERSLSILSVCERSWVRFPARPQTFPFALGAIVIPPFLPRMTRKRDHRMGRQ